MENVILINHNKNWGLDDIFVEKLAKKALKEKGYNEDVELSIYFVGRKKARDLNINYRQKILIHRFWDFQCQEKKMLMEKLD